MIDTQVIVYIGDLNDAEVLNELWDAWVPAAHPPVRAMVQVGLGKSCKVEMVVTAATAETSVELFFTRTKRRTLVRERLGRLRRAACR